MEDNGRDIAGQFKPGHPGFKKPKTEFQRMAKNKIGDFLKDKLEDLPAIYDKLSPKEKAKLILHCVDYFVPRQREMKVEIEDVPQASIDYTKLSENALNELLSLVHE